MSKTEYFKISEMEIQKMFKIKNTIFKIIKKYMLCVKMIQPNVFN